METCRRTDATRRRPVLAAVGTGAAGYGPAVAHLAMGRRSCGAGRLDRLGLTGPLTAHSVAQQHGQHKTQPPHGQPCQRQQQHHQKEARRHGAECQRHQQQKLKRLWNHGAIVPTPAMHASGAASAAGRRCQEEAPLALVSAYVHTCPSKGAAHRRTPGQPRQGRAGYPAAQKLPDLTRAARVKRPAKGKEGRSQATGRHEWQGEMKGQI